MKRMLFVDDDTQILEGLRLRYSLTEDDDASTYLPSWAAPFTWDEALRRANECLATDRAP